jgi:chromosome partitioning protein
VFDVIVSNRVAFSHAVIDGRSVHEYEPGGKAATEIDELFQVISDRLKI